MKSDTTIFTICVGILIAINFLIPLINEGFGSSGVQSNVSGFEDGFQDLQTTDESNVFSFFQSLLGVIFFSFGIIPFWLDVILFAVLRVPMYIIIGKWIRGVGT